jgi:type VI secretion system secreted protein Hcp
MGFTTVLTSFPPLKEDRFMAADIFLKIEGLDGESQDSKHKGEIDLASYSWGASQQGSAHVGGGLGSGKVQIHDLQCMTSTNKSSPALMAACASGEHFSKATLTTRKAGKEQQEYLIITMTDVLVSNYQLAHHASGSDLPTDQFSLNFSKIEYEYKEQKKDGTLGGKVKKGWDVKQNKAS